jgi:Flp pilus assembly protein TadD
LAKVLARQGRFERAEVLAREAVEVLQPEMIMARSYANLDLAVVLATAGRKNEAKAAATQAEAFFEAKGNLVSLAEARRFLAELG